MTTTELKKLAERCICHPLSSSVREVESAGKAIKELLAINAELVERLKWIKGNPRVHPANLEKIIDAVLAKAEGGEL